MSLRDTARESLPTSRLTPRALALPWMELPRRTTWYHPSTCWCNAALWLIPVAANPSPGADRLKQDRCELPPAPDDGQEESADGEEEAECERKVNMLVIAGPTSDLLEGEAEVLDDS